MEAKTFPMNGGDGAYSYTKNSQYQRASLNAAKDMIKKAIVENFDVTFLNSNSIRMADLGCSVGPNTFVAMQNVLEAIVDSNPTSKIIEFQVFFSDHISNDFNTLFTTLPPDRQYFAAGVPGSFHSRLFPKSSLHFVHSSYALQWLSEVPEELLDKRSVAWNKGKIHYTGASEQVANAYATQFAKDMDIFFSSRADEITSGGMMILIMPALPDEVHYSELPAGVLFHFLEQSLADMVKAVEKQTKLRVITFWMPRHAILKGKPYALFGDRIWLSPGFVIQGPPPAGVWRTNSVPNSTRTIFIVWSVNPASPGFANDSPDPVVG